MLWNSLSWDSVTVSRWTARRYFHCLTELSLESPIKWQLNVLLQSLASIPQIDQSIFQINRPECKTVYSEPCHVLRREKCPDASRMFTLQLAFRCSKRTARKLPRCGVGARAKSTYCDLSSFGPALFEIWWPDIYLGGPYGPVKDKMYWPELARCSEKCAGPVLMSRAEWLREVWSLRQPTGDMSVYPLCGMFYFPWHRRQIEGTGGF